MTSRIDTALLFIPLLLSAFTHIWNPIGFPTFHTDEGGYIERAMQILNGQGVQESSFYDHPYFGSLLLSSVFSILNFPYSINISSDNSISANSVGTLYSYPRVFMGLLAVVDTFLVYQIAQRKYDRTVGFIASTIFAVMPITWVLRRIFLDTIMLPFLLLSILFAFYNTTKVQNNGNPYGKKIQLEKNFPVLLSGIFLGLAVFTKVPAFSFIPLVGFLIYRNNSLRTVGIWLIPVVLIPTIWPMSALAIGEFENWLAGISLQTHRINQPLSNSIYSFFKTDPILLIAGVASLGFAAIKKDYFLLLWAIPFLVFLYIIGYVSLFHMLPMLPIFSISIAVAAKALSDTISRKGAQRVFLGMIVSGISIFGLVSTTMIVTTTLNDINFEAAAFIATNIPRSSNANSEKDVNKITVIADPFYLWIPKYVLEKNQIYKGFENKTPLNTMKVFLVVDRGLMGALSRNDAHSQKLLKIYNTTKYLTSFNISEANYDFSKYPYSIISWPSLENGIEIRTNYK